MTVGRIEQLTNMPTDYTEEYISILERKLTAVTHYNAAECIAVLERKVAALEAENATLRKLVPAVPPTLYPDDASVLRAQITKLVQENQRLERENARLETIIDELRIQPND